MIFREMGAVSYTDRRKGSGSSPLCCLSQCAQVFSFLGWLSSHCLPLIYLPKKRASFKRFKTFLKIGVAALAHY